MKMKLALLLSSFVAVTLLSSLAHADDTGFAYMHDMKVTRGTVCMTNHFHYGASDRPYKTKRQARRAAIRAWQEFTAFEYGTDWARFNRARSKGMSCNKSGRWTCNVSARPCARMTKRRRAELKK